MSATSLISDIMSTLESQTTAGHTLANFDAASDDV
jgi:hypothetical protein